MKIDKNQVFIIFGCLSIILLLGVKLSFGQFYRPDIVTEPNFFTIHSSYLQDYDFPTEVEEGSELNHFQRWSSFWGPRLTPTGNFSIAAEAIQQYVNSYDLNQKSSSVNSNWTEIGPNVNNIYGIGQIKAIAFDPNDPVNIIYAGAPVGGVWKTIDGGQNWISLNTDQQFARLGASSIVIDPFLNSSGHNNIYVATGDLNSINSYSDGIYRSIDGGITWQAINTNLFNASIDFNYIPKLLIDPSNSNTLFAATSIGIYKCTNRGAITPTWTKVYPSVGDERIRNILFEPGNNQILYASGANITKSINGGATWNTIGTIGSGLELIGAPNFLGNFTHPNFPDRFIDDINIEISADNAYLYAVFKIRDDIPPYLYNAFIEYALYRYDISTQQWSLRALPWKNGNSSNGIAPQYRLTISVSPLNNNFIILGDVRVYFSLNGGSTSPSWIYPTQYYYHDDIHAIKYSPVDPNIVFTGGDGGIFKFEINQQGNLLNSTELNNGLGVATIYSTASSKLDPYQVLIGNQDNGINYLKSGNWSHKLTSDGMSCLMDNDDIDRMYATIYSPKNGTIRRSQDPTGTATFPSLNYQIFGFSSSQQEAIFITPLEKSNINSKTIFQGREDVWKCNDASVAPLPTWQKISDFHNPPPGTYLSTYTYQVINSIAIAPSDENTIYVSLINDYFEPPSSPNNYYRLFKTSSGGGSQNWSEITPNASLNLPISDIIVSSTDPNHLWISYSGYTSTTKVKESIDGGTTWVDINSGLPNLPVNCLVYENGSNDGIYVGTDVGVYFKNGLMSSWVPFMNSLPNTVVSQLEINYTENKIRAATYGRGLWESSLACPEPYLLINGNIPSSIQEASIVDIDNANLSPLNKFYVRGVDYINVIPTSGEITFEEGSYANLFIHNCEVPGNSSVLRIQNGDDSFKDEKIDISENQSPSFKLFPNPTSGKVYIESVAFKAEGEVINIQLYDLAGKPKISQKTFYSEEIYFDISDLPEGIYFVKISGSNFNSNHKVIKL